MSKSKRIIIDASEGDWKYIGNNGTIPTKAKMDGATISQRQTGPFDTQTESPSIPIPTTRSQPAGNSVPVTPQSSPNVSYATSGTSVSGHKHAVAMFEPDCKDCGTMDDLYVKYADQIKFVFE